MKAIKLVFAIIAWLFSTGTTSAGNYNEDYFVRLIAKTKIKGKVEHRLFNQKRVDLLTDTHAYEVDWLHKAWSEGIGQALHYAIATGKKPGVIALVDKPHNANLSALLKTAEIYNIDVKVFYVNKQNGKIEKEMK